MNGIKQIKIDREINIHLFFLLSKQKGMSVVDSIFRTYRASVYRKMWMHNILRSLCQTPVG